MKRLKLIILTIFLLSAGISEAAITITGHVNDGNNPAVNILVTATDPVNLKTDTTRTDAQGNYTFVYTPPSVNPNKEIIVYITDCNATLKSKTIKYTTTSGTFSNIDLQYCRVFQGQTYTISIEGTITNIPTSAGSINLFCDTNGGFRFSAMQVQVSNGSPNYKFTFRTTNPTKSVRMFFYDCYGDTASSVVTTTSTSLIHKNVDINYCGPTAPYTVSVSGYVTNLPLSSPITVLMDTTYGGTGHLSDVVTRASNQYNISFVTTSPSGKLKLFLIDCNHDTISKVVNYIRSSPNYVRVDLKYCNTNPNINNISVKGDVTNCQSLNWEFIYCDSLGGYSKDFRTGFNKSVSSYQFVFPQKRPSGTIKVHLVDCQGDTLEKTLSYSNTKRSFTNVDFDFCANGPLPNTVAGKVHVPFTIGSNDITVELFEIASTGITSVQSSMADVSGNYSFANPDIAKEYCVLAKLNSSSSEFGNYEDTYGDSSLTWRNANNVTTGSNGLIQRDIWLIKKTKETTDVTHYYENDEWFSAFPNPAESHLQIRFSDLQEQTKVSVLNSLGKTVLQTTVERANTISLDVHELTSGVYFLQLQDEQRIKNLQFIKK